MKKHGQIPKLLKGKSYEIWSRFASAKPLHSSYVFVSFLRVNNFRSIRYVFTYPHRGVYTYPSSWATCTKNHTIQMQDHTYQSSLQVFCESDGKLRRWLQRLEKKEHRYAFLRCFLQSSGIRCKNAEDTKMTSLDAKLDCSHC